MEWTPTIAASLARYGCPDCKGEGLLLGFQPADLCYCVYRSVFRACFRRFQRCAENKNSLKSVGYIRYAGGVDRTKTWARRSEDYRADFHSCGLRSLGGTRHLYQFFSFYYLHGAPQDVICRRLGIGSRCADKWMHDIEAIVGREIAHLQPYSLYPPKGYMIPVKREVHACPVNAVVNAEGRLLSF